MLVVGYRILDTGRSAAKIPPVFEARIQDTEAVNRTIMFQTLILHVRRSPSRQAGLTTKLTKGKKKAVENKISCFFVRFVVNR